MKQNFTEKENIYPLKRCPKDKMIFTNSSFLTNSTIFLQTFRAILHFYTCNGRQYFARKPSALQNTI